MKKGSKERLFEVMGRLDKTFKLTLNENEEETKPKLNEGFEEIEPNDDEITVPAENGEENSIEDAPEMEEKTPEEKLQDIIAKVDEIYALVHDDDSEEIPAEQPEEIETGEIDVDNLQETELDEHHLKR